MSVNDVSGTQSVYDKINSQNQSSSTSTQSSGNADSEMFMKLMIAQLQNQDPTSPAETSEPLIPRRRLGLASLD